MRCRPATSSVSARWTLANFHALDEEHDGIDDVEDARDCQVGLDGGAEVRVDEALAQLEAVVRPGAAEHGAERLQDDEDEEGGGHGRQPFVSGDFDHVLS